MSSKYGELFKTEGEYKKITKEDEKNVRGVIVSEPHETWSCDLIFINLPQRKNQSIFLNCVDVFSRKVWTVKLKNKKSESIIKGFEEVFKKAGTEPRNLWTDNEGGIESAKFDNFIEKHNINVYHTYGTVHNPIVERFNRTQKELVEKMKSDKPIEQKIEKVNEVYNNTEHRTLNMSPNDALNKKKKKRFNRNTKKTIMNQESKEKTI